jgi:tetratricopeptide (TPR) repeat protein
MYWKRMTGSDPVPLEERIRSTQDALEIGERLRIADLETFAARMLGELYVVGGSFDHAVEMSRRQLAVLDRVESPQERALILFEVAMTTMDLAGDYGAGLELAQRSYREAAERSAHELMHATYGLLSANHHLGRWSDVPPILSEHLEALREEADVTCFAVRAGPAIGALVLAHQGEPERAREVANMVPPVAKEMSTPRADGLRARLMVATGDPAAGYELAESVITGWEFWRAPEAVLAGIEALIALKDWRRLDSFLTKARPFGAGSAPVGPTIDRAKGLMNGAAGQVEAAAALLRQALSGFERLGITFEIARTKEALADVSSPREAEALLTDALDTYESLGARPHADRARGKLSGEGR